MKQENYSVFTLWLLASEHLYENDNIQSQGTSLSIKIWILILVVDNIENAKGHMKM
jgi:hypothetical protein